MEGPPRIALGLARSKRAVIAVSLRTREGAPAENQTRTRRLGNSRDLRFTTGADGRLTGNRTQTCQVEAGHDCCFTMSRNGAGQTLFSGPTRADGAATGTCAQISRLRGERITVYALAACFLFLYLEQIEVCFCVKYRQRRGIPCGFCPRFSWVKSKNPS